MSRASFVLLFSSALTFQCSPYPNEARSSASASGASASSASASNTRAAVTPVTFPVEEWRSTDPASLGWVPSKIDEVKRFAATLPPASAMVIDRGYVIAQWGDPARRVKVSSIRKSLLSALIGIHVAEGAINLDQTLEELGVDDSPPLTTTEKHATVKMLLQSRSGVYHNYVAGTPKMLDGRPVRGSHEPGSFWYYNNWDFNALGTIFEQTTHTKIVSDFVRRIATPIGMQDFREQDMYYLANSPNEPQQSNHRAYHFRLTVRDMARFGYLFLRKGRWRDTSVVPEEWVAASVRPYSETGHGGGYGYLWWVDGLGVPAKSYSAQGALGKNIIVFPERGIVVAYQNHTELPDDAQLKPKSEIAALPTISDDQLAHLLTLILEAQGRGLETH